MKLVIDERMKHRLTGLLVIISVVAIFLPAMMKNSGHRFNESLRIASAVPKKPEQPKVNIPSEKALFKTVTVATVDAKKMAPEKPRVSQLVQVTSSVEQAASKQPVVAKTKLEPTAPIVQAKVLPITASQKAVYAVQLASFTQKNNAQALVKRLKTEGYDASYNTIMKKQGPLYKVVVGQLSQRNDAMDLRKNLVDNMQLKGFIVKTGVS